MAIGNAYQKGTTIIIYDEKGRTLFTKFCGSKPSDGLKGYTSSTVTVQNGSALITYDEKGNTKFTKFV